MYFQDILAKLYLSQDKVLAFNHAAAMLLKGVQAVWNFSISTPPSNLLIYATICRQARELRKHSKISTISRDVLIYRINPFNIATQKKNKKKGENSKDCWEVFFLMWQSLVMQISSQKDIYLPFSRSLFGLGSFCDRLGSGRLCFFLSNSLTFS